MKSKDVPYSRIYKYVCISGTGGLQRGNGETTLEIGSDEMIHSLLNEISDIVMVVGMPWDPFNLELIVKALPEPKQFYKPSDL
jgi:hypothetical protein